VLWVAFHFPQLRQQALARGHAPPEPEREALEAAAAWACQFTPRVSLERPESLVMETGGSLRYFQGLKNFLGKIRAGLTHLGFEAALACAPTARAALWRATGGGAELGKLPVSVIGLEADERELLAGLGVRTLNDLMRLPREGVARRLGSGLVEQLDRALGRSSEAREFFVPPERFAQQLELPAQVTEAERALFVARRLLAQLEGFLAARQAGVRGFRLLLLHPDVAPTEVSVGLASASRGAEHFARLLLERLQRAALPGPIEAVRLEAADPEPLAERSGDFFGGPGEGGEAWLRLVERLQARLGREAVHGLDLHDDHRPERAFCQVDFENGNSKTKAQPGNFLGSRPLWLLEAPRRLGEGDFVLLAGPERIESGWWDGEETRRDYFIARTGESSLAWIYRERKDDCRERRGGWFVHGFFA
jgi:protein ImuB